MPATALGALLLIAGIGLVYVVLKGGSHPPTTVSEQHPPAFPSPTATATETAPSASPSPTPHDTKVPQSPNRPAVPFYALLVPGGPARSGGGEKEVRLSPGAVNFELPLVSDTSYRTYRVTLETNGKVIKTWARLNAVRSKPVNVIRISVPADQLQVSQRYRFVLNGLSSNNDLQHVEDYYFRMTN
jgi:hypothetical protein